MLILAILTACGDEQLLKRMPEELPFQLTFDPEKYTLEHGSDAWFLRPIPVQVVTADRQLIEMQECYNQKVSQCSIGIWHLAQPASEAAASNRQDALGEWFLVTETETIQSLNGIGFFTIRQEVDDDIFAEYRVFVPDPQGGCYQLVAHYEMNLDTLDRQFWEIVQSFTIIGPSQQATPAKTGQRPLGEVRNNIAYGSTWQKAYLAILSAPQNYLMDINHNRSFLSAKGIVEPNFYVGVHDFNLDGVPELIIGDGNSLGVFSYADKKTIKLADLCDTETPWCVNGVFWDNNAVLVDCNGAGCRKYIVFGYLDGEYRMGIYSDMSDLRITINGEPATQEDLDRIYPITDAYSNESHCRKCIKRLNKDGEIILETETGITFRVDEDFYFNGFVWE